MLLVKPFNAARVQAIESFLITLDALRNRNGVTEELFRDEWLTNLGKFETTIADGWYQPPPRGATILAGSSSSPERISFTTLRDRAFWSSAQKIDWHDCLLYAYCSPISRSSGLPGDFALTLYLGRSENLISHFKRAHRALSELLVTLSAADSPADVFWRSQKLFSQHRLENSVISITDSTPLDLGHTFPALDPAELKSTLTTEQCNQVRQRRKFLNGKADWQLTREVEFTLEPQLRSTDDSGLPQVTFHYLARLGDSDIEIQDDIDPILKRFGLTS